MAGNSFIAVRNTKARPVSSPGRSRGIVTVAKTRAGVAAQPACGLLHAGAQLHQGGPDRTERQGKEEHEIREDEHDPRLIEHRTTRSEKNTSASATTMPGSANPK